MRLWRQLQRLERPRQALAPWRRRDSASVLLSCLLVALVSSWPWLVEPSLRPGVAAPFTLRAPKAATVVDSDALEQRRSQLGPRTHVQVVDPRINRELEQRLNRQLQAIERLANTGQEQVAPLALSPEERFGADWGRHGAWQWRGHHSHWRVLGEDHQPPLVLLHGFGAASGHWRRNAAVLAAATGLALLAPAAGAAAKPKRGSIVYAIPGKTTSFCIPRAQLSASGIMVTQSLYDTLTVPNDKGQYVPYLAKSVTPNATFDEWTIGLRDGVTFADGTPVDAAAVKQNIDAWRKGLLLQFLYAPVSDVSAPDPKTVVVRIKQPWPAFPAFLFSAGRTAIAII